MVWWPLTRHKLQHVCIGVTLMVPMCRIRVPQTHAHEMAGLPLFLRGASHIYSRWYVGRWLNPQGGLHIHAYPG